MKKCACKSDLCLSGTLFPCMIEVFRGWLVSRLPALPGARVLLRAARGPLGPHSQTVRWDELRLYAVGGGPRAPTSALPIGAWPARPDQALCRPVWHACQRMHAPLKWQLVPGVISRGVRRLAACVRCGTLLRRSLSPMHHVGCSL